MQDAGIARHVACGLIMASLRRWLGSTGDRLLDRLERWALDERVATRVVERFPASSLSHRLLAKSYIRNGKPSLAVDLLLGASTRVRRAKSIVAVLDKALRDKGDHVTAHSVLHAARAAHPSDPEILVRLCSLHEDDSQLKLARAFLVDAERLGYDDPARRLNIETALGDFAAGRETLRALMRSEGAALLRAAAAVNRFAPCYQELASEVSRFQDAVREAVRSDAGLLSASRRVELALSCRMIEEARTIVEQSAKAGKPLRRRVARDYRTIREQSECIDLYTQVAWENERADTRRFAGLAGERQTVVDIEAYDPDRVVEVFIPAVFYSNTEPAKQRTYPLIRQAFGVLLNRIAQRQDITIVPRHQFNWRICRPALQGKVLSYHTRGCADVRHLRLKEGALSGYVTLDHRGYAGFSSAATDFDEIHAAAADVPHAALEENRARLYEKLVLGAKSKYLQPAETPRIAGKYVFVALQVVTDEVADLAWISCIELLRQVARLYSGTDTRVVVKRHPLCKSFTLQAAMLELERQQMIVVSRASIHSLISGAEVVFTVNSGVGLEALVHGRPVVVSGLCDYAYAACCVRNLDELESAVAHARVAAIKGLEFLYFYTHAHAFEPTETRRLEDRVDAWLACSVPPDHVAGSTRNAADQRAMLIEAQ